MKILSYLHHTDIILFHASIFELKKILSTLMVSITVLFLSYSAVDAEALLFDFEDLETGEIISSQYFDDYGVIISAKNFGWGPNLAIIFDSQNPTGSDYDLAGPSWEGGNLATGNTVLGKILIIAENDIDANLDGLVDNPDDEGNRPAGSILFEFESKICSVGFDLIDVEGPSEFGRDSGFVATFFIEDISLARVGFDQFINEDSIFFDTTVEYGNNKANRILPITVEQLSEYTGTKITAIDRVEFNLGGSSAIDNVDVSNCNESGAKETEKIFESGGKEIEKLYSTSNDSDYQDRIKELEQKVGILEVKLLEKNNEIKQKDSILLEQLKVINDIVSKMNKVIFQPILTNLSLI